MSTPPRPAMSVRLSTSPGPPPHASTVRPPQKRTRPSVSNDCRPYMGRKRTPWPDIQRRVSKLSSISLPARSGSVRYSVMRPMSS